MTAAPTVTGLSPTTGSTAGGTPVTITGTGFTGATAVDFGTTAGDRSHRGQRYHDHRRQPGGDGHGGCDRDDPGGVVGHFARRSVHLHGGRHSDGHGPEPHHRFRGRRHAGDDHRHQLHRRDSGRLRHDGGDGLTVVNDTTITADSPAGTGVVDVTVTTPAGTSATSPADQFTYVLAAAPTVTGLSPPAARPPAAHW